MPKLLFLALLLCVSPLYGANKIKMVTYFPVPYVSYNQLDVSKTLDIGVVSGRSAFLSLGPAANPNTPVLNVFENSTANASSPVVNQGGWRVKSGRLDLNNPSGIVISQMMTVGAYSGTDGGDMIFNNSLRWVSQSNRGQSVMSTGANNNMSALRLFPAQINRDADANLFPSCVAGVTWQTLYLGPKNEQDTVLVCGTGS